MNIPALKSAFILCCCFVAPLATAATSVAAGSEHSLVLKDDGSVWAWGSNHSGQLGNGSALASTSPIKIPSLTNVAAIAAGGYHNLALLTDGTVWAWGDNDESQLGNGSTQDQLSPVQVTGISNAIAVVAGMYHSVVLTAQGDVWTWGDNSNAQLGDGSLDDRLLPAIVNNLSGITAISAGYWFSYALKDDGSIWYWGYNIHAPPVMSADVFFMIPVPYLIETWDDVLAQGQTAQKIVLPNSSETVLIASSLEHTVMMRPDGTVLESSQSVTASPTELTQATEVQWTGSVTVSLSPISAVSSGVLWRVGGGVWQQSGESAHVIEGDYTIEFSSNTAWSNPAPIPVTVSRGTDTALNTQFSARQGALSVHINSDEAQSAGAQWRIASTTNDGTWHNSNQLISGLIPGEYTVEYLNLPLWATPTEEEVLIRHNTTTTVAADYSKKMATLIVRLGPENIFDAGGQWRIAGEQWRKGSMNLVDLQPGLYSIEFSTAEGWQAPQNFSINVAPEGAVINAAYASLTGTAVVTTGGHVPSGVTPEIIVAENDTNDAEISTDGENTTDTDVANAGDNIETTDDADINTSTDPNEIASGGDDTSLGNTDFNPAPQIEIKTNAYTELNIHTTTAVDIAYIGDTGIYTFDGRVGQKYLFNSNADGDIQLSIYDSDGLLIKTNSSHQDENRFVWIAPTSGYFYVSVEFNDGWSTGEITFNVALRGVAYDFNGDGHADLLGRDVNDNGAIALIYVDDNQFGNSISPQYRIDDGVDGGWQLQTVGDFNGDRNADLVWRAQSGQVVVWMMDSEKLIDASGITSEYVGGLAAWSIVDSGDFNGDGKSDLIWRHDYSGQIALWFMDSLEVLPTSGLVSNQAGNSSAWNIASIGDFNGDGRSDLLWRHKQLGYTAIWLMDGLNHTKNSDLTSQQIDTASHWEIVTSDDFNADGKSDIFWRNSNDGRLFIWFMDGVNVTDSNFVSNTLETTSAWHLAKIADYNGDGRADLLWQKEGMRQFHAWLMNGVHPVNEITESKDEKSQSELAAWDIVTQ